jgi:hypothetical protein
MLALGANQIAAINVATDSKRQDRNGCEFIGG